MGLVVSRPGARGEHMLGRAEVSAEPHDDVLAAAARRDPAAFDALYTRYVAAIYRFCHVRLGTREAAEDATSAVFLKTLSAIGSYREGNFAGWLFRIAANTVVDLQRACRPSAPLDRIPEPIDPAPEPELAMLQRLDREALRAALATLPDEQRAAVELRLAGWSSERIATALGRSPEAVRMLRHRALTRLRATLTDIDAHGGRS